jgi:hypothetical protein
MSDLKQKLGDEGYLVYHVPEAATMMAKGGCNLNLTGKHEEYVLKFQARRCGFSHFPSTLS